MPSGSAGPAFSATPGVLEFRDFDVGKCHVAKVTWTNISRTKASIRFEYVAPQLLGVVTVGMKPSGWLGPGITSSTKVEFRPEVGKGKGGQFIAQEARVVVVGFCWVVWVQWGGVLCGVVWCGEVSWGAVGRCWMGCCGWGGTVW